MAVACEFVIFRYQPNPLRDDFVNIGVALRQKTGGDFIGVRFLRDWSTVKSLDEDADIKMLETCEEFVRNQLKTGNAVSEHFLADLAEISSNAIQLSNPQSLECDSPESEFEKIALAHIGR